MHVSLGKNDSWNFRHSSKPLEQSKGYFLNVTYDAHIEETVCRQKTSKFFLFFFEKIHEYTRLYKEIRDFFQKQTNSRHGFCKDTNYMKYTIDEKLDTRQLTGLQ